MTLIVTKKKIRESLEEARVLMNNDGAHWTRHMEKKFLGNGEAAFCALGAIKEVVGEDDRRLLKACHRTVADAIRPRSPGEMDTTVIWHYNDGEASGWSDVDSKFRQAISSL